MLTFHFNKRVEKEYNNIIKPNLKKLEERLKNGNVSYMAGTCIIAPDHGVLVAFDVKPLNDCLFNEETLYFQYLTSLSYITIKKSTGAFSSLAQKNVNFCRVVGLDEPVITADNEELFQTIKDFYEL
ncbi:MAG: hypothetical protein KJO69_09185 [Gammaproteobacteria bacterium]|nr:hypothetical protein [Gammaproteobacteria bacterium]